MNTPRIKGASRTQLQRAQRLHRREQRERYRQALVEGPQAVRELLAWSADTVRDVYATEEALERHPDIRELIAVTGVWTHLLDADAMRDLSGDGQGLAAVADIPESREPSALMHGAQLVIAVAELSDPGNLGTIVRTADAVGAAAVLIGKGSAELYSPKVIRSTAGSVFHVPCVTGLEFADMVRLAHDAGLQCFAADGAGEWELQALVNAAWEKRLLGTWFDGPDLTRPTMWILGNEAHGFTGRSTELVDARVSIPLQGQAESLNVSMAGAICAYTSLFAQNAE